MDVTIGHASLDAEVYTIAHRINSYLGPNLPQEEVESTLFTQVNIFSQLMIEGPERVEGPGLGSQYKLPLRAGEHQQSVLVEARRGHPRAPPCAHLRRCDGLLPGIHPRPPRQRRQ